MEHLYEKALESAEYIKTHTKKRPKIAVVLGSGLGKLTADFTDTEELSYKDIPNFPVSTVAGHKGALLAGKLGDTEVYAMEGRFHFYEGYSMKEVCYPFYVFKLLDVEKVVLTNACGGINREFAPGTLMLITDFINMMGTNPLIGPNDERFGPRFPDMTEPYSLELRNLAKQTADELGIAYKEGVYMGFMGPCYETAAEIRAFAGMGADAVKQPSLKDMKVKDMTLDFTIKDGRVETKPFDIKMGDYTLNLSGSTGLDQTIDYSGKVKLPASVGNISKLMTLDLKIGGSFTSPKVSVDTKSMANQAVEAVADEAISKLGQKLGLDSAATANKDSIKQKVTEKAAEKALDFLKKKLK